MPPIPLRLDEVIGKQDSMPMVLQHASKIVFTPAGVAATVAALLSSCTASAEAASPGQSVQQQVQQWEKRIAGGTPRPQSACFRPGAD